MRTAHLLRRLLCGALAIVTIGLLLAPPTGAQPPLRLSGYLTDDAGVLSNSGRGAVQSAVDKLYNDRHIRLWVIYVDNFSGQGALSWAQQTRLASDLGDFDALLAVATTDRAYAFLVPLTVKTVSPSQVENLRRNQVEPALRRDDWSGAAVAAANGLNPAPRSVWLPVLIGVVIVGIIVVVLILIMRFRRNRRRAAESAAARRVDPGDPLALAAVPLDALDQLSRSIVVDVDNAVRTSSNELSLAIAEFGEERTEPFTRAVTNAKAALSQAFSVRQQLDDAVPETPAQRRELLTRVIVSAARADRELGSQTEAFERLREFVINAPTRLDALTQQVVELSARISPAEQRLAALHNEFDAAALTSISGNVENAKKRLAFAEQNIVAARELTARAVSGQQSRLVDTVRATEAALGQVGALLDAVDSAASDIHHAAAMLPSAITDIQAAIEQANTALQKLQGAQNAPKIPAANIRDLTTARDAAVTAVDFVRRSGAADPLGAFSQLTKANADLNRLLASVAEEQASADRLNRTLEQALFTAQSRVRAVSDYIDTRRGSIGPDARTRLAEATRHLQAAQDKRATNPVEAIAHANGAAALAAQAQSLANTDVQSAQLSYAGRYPGGGNDWGAMIGGIIIGDLLSGGMRGGLGGGWSPTSFGGSSGPSDDGFMGGGGRF